MFGGHGHSHEGSGGHHGHSHDGGKCQGHNNFGFGDEDESGNKKAPNPNLNMMMMMANAMKMNENANLQQGGAEVSGDGTPSGNNVMMNPQMMEFAKKMFEQRQQLMKQYMEQGGHSNPAALQELMKKAAEAQSQAIAQFKAANMDSNKQNEMNIGNAPNTDNKSLLIPPITMPNPMDMGKNNSHDASSMLNANLNESTLDDLINNRRSTAKKAKEDEEKKILDSIAKKDYSELNAVKATQYGVFERVKELIESGQVDPHKPDNENVYLLHWAAINNRIDIAKYLLSLGVQVDPIGGELESSPLNWAARSGHIQMVIMLMEHGANPQLFDVEGFSTLHLATMFAHSHVAAYLLVKGIDVSIIYLLIQCFFKPKG